MRRNLILSSKISIEKIAFARFLLYISLISASYTKIYPVIYTNFSYFWGLGHVQAFPLPSLMVYIFEFYHSFPKLILIKKTESFVHIVLGTSVFKWIECEIFTNYLNFLISWFFIGKNLSFLSVTVRVFFSASKGYRFTYAIVLNI